MSGDRPRAVAVADSNARTPQPWYRRRGNAVALAVVGVLVVAVLTDLPVPDNRAADVASARAVISQTNTDLAACSNAASEAFQLYGLRTSGTITGYERANAGQWLSQDIVACSLASAQVFDLSNIVVPRTPSGTLLDDMLSAATLWATSDALDAMSAIQRLMADPTSVAARTSLQSQWRLMVAHRADANRAIQLAATMLATPLPRLGLPQLPRPATTLLR